MRNGPSADGITLITYGTEYSLTVAYDSACPYAVLGCKSAIGPGPCTSVLSLLRRRSVQRPARSPHQSYPSSLHRGTQKQQTWSPRALASLQTKTLIRFQSVLRRWFCQNNLAMSKSRSQPIDSGISTPQLGIMQGREHMFHHEVLPSPKGTVATGCFSQGRWSCLAAAGSVLPSSIFGDESYRLQGSTS